MNWDINIEFYKDRAIPGKLILTVDGELNLDAICLGIADRQAAIAVGNPTCDPLHKNGNTPCGVYRGQWEDLDPGRFPAHSYGVSGCVALTPISGDCLTAAQNGRTGLLIHSGDLNSNPNVFGGMRPTHGCVRVKPPTMEAIARLIEGAGEVKVKEIDESSD